MNTMMDSPEMQEADAALERDLTNIFSNLAGSLLPASPVVQIHSHGLCEDGETLMILVDLQDGSTAAISVCPGSPIACTLHDVGH